MSSLTKREKSAIPMLTTQPQLISYFYLTFRSVFLHNHNPNP